MVNARWLLSKHKNLDPVFLMSVKHYGAHVEVASFTFRDLFEFNIFFDFLYIPFKKLQTPEE